MKFYLAIILLLSAWLTSAYAQSDADGRYVVIYGLIQQGDTAMANNQNNDALTAYLEAQKQLQGFQKMFPDWDAGVVSYRLNDLAGKIAGLQAQTPPPSTAISAGAAVSTNLPADRLAKTDQQLMALQQQLQAAQDENARLQAKLKEAFATQPTMVDASQLTSLQEQLRVLMKENALLKVSTQTAVPKIVVVSTNLPSGAVAKADSQLATLRRQLRTMQDENSQLQSRLKSAQKAQSTMVDANELAKAQEQIRSLTKENSLLKTSLSASKNKSDDGAANAKIAELSREVDALNSRLAADEAKPVPYSEAELALLKSSPAPMPTKIEVVQKTGGQPLSIREEKLMASAAQHFSSGEYDAAEADYQKILETAPNNAVALGNLAMIEMQAGKFSAAETHIKAALVSNPDDAFNLAALGKIKFSQNDFDGAIDALSRSAKIEPKNPETQNYLGLAFSNKGLRVQAEAALRKAIELDPNYAPAQNNLAAFYLTQNPPSPQLALWHYQKAIAAGQPRNPDLEKMLTDKGAPFSAPK